MHYDYDGETKGIADLRFRENNWMPLSSSPLFCASFHSHHGVVRAGVGNSSAANKPHRMIPLEYFVFRNEASFHSDDCWIQVEI